MYIKLRKFIQVEFLDHLNYWHSCYPPFIYKLIYMSKIFIYLIESSFCTSASITLFEMITKSVAASNIDEVIILKQIKEIVLFFQYQINK